MNPIAKTLMMAIVAAVACAAAFYYYPKIEVAKATNRQTLLTEKEEFTTNEISRVKIEQFDRINNQPTQFELVRSEDSWVVDGQGNFPASNTSRVGDLMTIMSKKKILEEVSDNQDDHEKYEVIETAEAPNTGTGVGTTVTFEDRSRNVLGKMIIGKKAKLENQRYVRLAGQPQIYLVEIDDVAMSTQLKDWINPDLLRLGPQPPLQDIDHIDVDLYYMDDSQVRKSGERKYVYRARIKLDGENWKYDLWQSGADQKLDDEPIVKDQPVNVNTALIPFFRQLQAFAVNQVIRKQPDVALDFFEPSADQPESHFVSLFNQGFRRTGFEYGQHQLDGAAGEITIVYRFGVRQKLYFGSAAAVDVSGGGMVSRFMICAADFDESIVPKPQKPGENAEEKEAGSEENAEKPAEGGASSQQPAGNQEEAERKYQADLESRNELIKVMTERTSALNQLHADWIYVVQEDVVSRLFPPADAWKNQ